MKKTIAVLPGDGVGPEVIEAAVDVTVKVAERYGHQFNFVYGLIGALAIDKTGDPLPPETLSLVEKADAILFGAIGDPRFDQDPTAKVRPEQGLLRLRKSLGLYANVRPIFALKGVIKASPLKEEIVEGIDFVVVRELTGGIYFGEKGRRENGEVAYDTNIYSKKEIVRVAKVAFDLAKKRRKKLTVVDKANVLETSRLWRETIQTLKKDYSQVEVEFLYVDNAAMQIIKKPKEFDVILTENMFGDILTDEAAVIAGSIGILPSASLGEKTALYEPIHGSYPKAAGKGIANPIGAILSAALMFEYSFQRSKEAKLIFQAVDAIVKEGAGTVDINKTQPLSTKKLTEKIIDNIMRL
jgi:3-isopropylmalate dehydrogenase